MLFFMKSSSCPFTNPSVLASLNLPAAIEDLSGEKVPQSVLEKASSIRERGGTQMIDQMMQNLPDLLARNREIADEVYLYFYTFNLCLVE